jgi:hypothetical protein
MSYEFYDKLLDYIEQLQTSVSEIRELVKTRIKEVKK